MQIRNPRGPTEKSILVSVVTMATDARAACYGAMKKNNRKKIQCNGKKITLELQRYGQ